MKKPKGICPILASGRVVTNYEIETSGGSLNSRAIGVPSRSTECMGRDCAWWGKCPAFWEAKGKK